MALFFFAVWRALKEHSYFIIGKFEILSPVGFGVFCALLAFRACVGGTRIQTACFEMRDAVEIRFACGAGGARWVYKKAIRALGGAKR